ncbi:MAG: glycosyl hydrolase [Desulfatirhabdiaceae bacterium]
MIVSVIPANAGIQRGHGWAWPCQSLNIIWSGIVLFAFLITTSPAYSNENTKAMRLIAPETGAYTGAYVDFGDGEDNVTLEAIENFEKMVGKHQAVIACGAFWGEQHFPKRNVKIITRYGAIPLLFWSPWDKPYAESKPPDQFGLNHILSGKWDGYIDQWAEDARTWGKPLLVAWGLEMNGTWFPWSGIFYGGGEKISAGKNTVYKGPDTFKKAYRYVVDRVRAKGATNIQWIFHVNHTTLPKEKWNEFAAYYPGPEYVDWLGMSVYGMMNKWQGWAPFYEAFYHAYEEICLIDPIKPVIVAEWGVGEFPAKGNKGEWLTTALNIMKTQSPRVKAAVYWHERWQNEDETYSNLRISSSPESIEAYRQGISDAYWIDRPVFAP